MDDDDDDDETAPTPEDATMVDVPSVLSAHHHKKTVAPLAKVLTNAKKIELLVAKVPATKAGTAAGMLNLHHHNKDVLNKDDDDKHTKQKPTPVSTCIKSQRWWIAIRHSEIWMRLWLQTQTMWTFLQRSIVMHR